MKPPVGTTAAALQTVPTGAGLYSIFVDDPRLLPASFRLALESRGSRLLYIGCSEASVAERLLQEDCEHRRASTFFRGIGAVLGYRPKLGSLRGKSNQNNYRFGTGDTKKIVAWIREHISVCAVPVSLEILARLERDVIAELRPILNTTYNPEAFQVLADLREECRRIARA